MSNIIPQQNNDVNISVLKIAFFGTPKFAVPILEKLAQSGYKPAAVFCAPDKPIGRQQILTSPPIKITAQKYNIPVFQPANSHELVQALNPNPYTLIISAAYGLILPEEILDLPERGCLNIHPSLLPKYRGPSPIQTAILNGDAETGVTIMKMAAKVDAGPIISNFQFSIFNLQFTTPELSQKLSKLGADLLLSTLPDYLANKITEQPQDESQATYTKIIKKEDGQIDWQKSAIAIERQIRAYTPWPGSYSNLKNGNGNLKTVKFFEADISEEKYDKPAGEIFLTVDRQLAVQTNDGALMIKKLQLAGGKPFTAEEFLRGHQDVIEKKFI